MRNFVILLIKTYSLLISPFLPQTCRFTPTCSEYSLEAVNKYGVIKGGFMSIKRISGCHPYNDGGYDPVE